MNTKPAPQHELCLKNLVTIPAHLIETLGERSLLRGLRVAAAGFSARSTERFPCTGIVPGQAMFVYCVGGCGWCEIAGRLHTVRRGDLLVIPPSTPHACGARASDPWSLHWARATGALLADYLDALTSGAQVPLLHVGEDPQLIRLFNEVLRSLQRGTGLAEMLRASLALSHLLAVVIEKRQQSSVADVDTTQKVAEAIIYMSEHLDEPVRISALARSASLSSAYFSGLFKQQTGCAPRDYLHLLRIHRACQLLRSTELSIKQVAARLGYQDQFHFSRQFKAFHGVSPTQYRGSPMP